MISIGDIVVVKKDFGQLKTGEEYYVFVGEGEANLIGITTGGQISYWPSRFFDIAYSRKDNALRLQFCLEFAEKETGRKYNAARPSWQWVFKYTFDEFIEFVDSNSLHRIFREVEEDVVSAVLWSCKTKEKAEKVRRALSKNHFSRILEDIENYGGVWNCEELISKFMQRVKMLEEMGEIVMARQDDSIQIEPFCMVPKPMSKEELKAKRERVQTFVEAHKKEREEFRAKKDKDVSDWKKQVGID